MKTYFLDPGIVSSANLSCWIGSDEWSSTSCGLDVAGMMLVGSKEWRVTRQWCSSSGELPTTCSATTNINNKMSASSSNIPSSTLAALADPPNRQIDAAVVDYFLIEMVNTLRTSSAVATARSKKIEQEMIDAGLLPLSAPVPPAKKESARDSTTNLLSTPRAGGKADEEEEALRTRLEAVGIHVGANYTERYIRFSPL